MNEKGRNPVASIRQRLINLSKERREDPNLVFIRYAIERFLYRLSRSKQSDKFVLKGAMLWAIWTGRPHRPTKDLDLLGFGEASGDVLQAIFREICTVVVEPDGMLYDPDSIHVTEIREDLDYPGQRVKIESRMGNARIPIQIDIGFGDAIVPAPVEMDYPTLLNMPAPHIQVYPMETVIAEKFETLVSRGILNSRMKDFYDLWILSRQFGFHGSRLAEAILGTFTRRRTRLPSQCPVALTEDFYRDPDKQVQWTAFLKTSKLETLKFEFSEVIEDLELFLMPPLKAVAAGSPFMKKWPPGGPWS